MDTTTTKTTFGSASCPKRDFWIRTETPEIVLAPMEGVTDAPLRAYFARFSPVTRLVTEFIRVSNNVLPAKVFRRQMPEIDSHSYLYGKPVHLQLLGGHPERMALTALGAVEAGAGAIDLNFGCPAPTVNRNEGGAALLKNPKLLEEIVREVRSAIPNEIPVSAKLRLGFFSIEEIDLTAEAAIRGGANWMTLHARTKVQGYAPPVNWEKIGQIAKRYPEIPVIANGDIWSKEDFLRCREITGCRHFMLGRGALARPYLLNQVAAELGIAPVQESGNWSNRFRIFAEMSRTQKMRVDSDRYILARMKNWLRFAQMKKEIDWFDDVKTNQSLELFLDSVCRSVSQSVSRSISHSVAE